MNEAYVEVNLVAPANYNITQELEQYAKDATRQAIRWIGSVGNRRIISYKQLIENMNQYANALTSLNIERGDRVLVIIPRLPEAYNVYLACLKAGIVPIACSEMLRAGDLQYRIEHASAKAVIAFDAFTTEINKIEVYDHVLKCIIGEDEKGWINLSTLAAQQRTEFEAAATSRDDMAFLSYTSGTTGKPKGVVHSHGWGYAHVRTAASNWLGVHEGDLVWATAAPG